MSREKRLVRITPGDGSPMVAIKPERNQKCTCGSGKKQKNCCGIKTKYYSTKPLMPFKKAPETNQELATTENN